jgi:hypothetical protein
MCFTIFGLTIRFSVAAAAEPVVSWYAGQQSQGLDNLLEANRQTAIRLFTNY